MSKGGEGLRRLVAGDLLAIDPEVTEVGLSHEPRHSLDRALEMWLAPIGEVGDGELDRGVTVGQGQVDHAGEGERCDCGPVSRRG